MKKKGIGSTVDILSLTIIISIACLILVGGVQQGKKETSHHAGITTQNTLLILQKVPVQELEKISYTPNFPNKNTSKRKLKNKPLSKIIKEEILLNPKWIIENRIIQKRTNKELSRELEKTLKNSLDSLIGKKFDYRLKIKMNPIRISEDALIFYRKEIETVSKNSQKICSRRIKLYFSIPQNWRGKESSKNIVEKKEADSANLKRESEIFGENFSNSDLSRKENMVPIYLTLELWSK